MPPVFRIAVPRRARAAAIAFGVVLALFVPLAPAGATPSSPLGQLTTIRAWGVDAFSAPDSTLSTLQRRMGKKFGSYAVYGMLDEAYKFPSANARAAIAANSLIYLNINSAHGDTQHRQPYCYIDIIHGRENRLIDAWSRAITGTHYSDIVISFQHEQSITTSVQPKCSTDTPAQYGQAFDFVVKRMRAGGVRAPFAWVSTASALAYGDAANYAPPAADYDVIGEDAYSGVGSKWRSASTQLSALFNWQTRHAPGKLLLLGEIGATETDARAPQWYADAINLLENHRDLLAVNWNVVSDRASGRMYSPLINAHTLRIWLAGASDPFFG